MTTKPNNGEGNLQNVECDHEWVVFSTALQEVCLLVQCVQCGAIGTVASPSKAEWSEAFHAPSRPYRWNDPSRVTIRETRSGTLYVVKASEDNEENERLPGSGGNTPPLHQDHLVDY